MSRYPLEVLDHRLYIGQRNAELARDLGLVAVRGQEDRGSDGRAGAAPLPIYEEVRQRRCGVPVAVRASM